MIRTQIQLTAEQARILKQLSHRKGKSMAELIRNSIEAMLDSERDQNQEEIYQKAFAAAGCIQNGPQDLVGQHDEYRSEAFEA